MHGEHPPPQQSVARGRAGGSGRGSGSFGVVTTTPLDQLAQARMVRPPRAKVRYERSGRAAVPTARGLLFLFFIFF